MNFDWPEELATFREQVRTYAQEHASPELIHEIESMEGPPGPLTRQVINDLEARGWIRISWPEELGGQAKSPWFQFVVAQELRYAGIAYAQNTAAMVGPAIHRFGTEAQKERYLAKVWSGEITCALGYSEPNAGTDLASLQTRAVRDGDEYVINGSKIWTSAAHRASHVWLACRTDPAAPKHRGISVFIVPLSTPGITIRPIIVLSGHRTNEVFYDNVRVPADALIGEENRGWYIMTNALDHERVTVGVNNYIELVRVFEKTMRYLREQRPDVLADAAARAKLAEIKLDLHCLRALLMRTTSIVADGDVPTKEASMVKVWATELRYRMTGTTMDLLGRAGVQTRESAEEAPVEGDVEQMFRHSAQARFTAGANEVQRTIIAQRGLGLPR